MLIFLFKWFRYFFLILFEWSSHQLSMFFRCFSNVYHSPSILLNWNFQITWVCIHLQPFIKQLIFFTFLIQMIPRLFINTNYLIFGPTGLADFKETLKRHKENRHWDRVKLVTAVRNKILQRGWKKNYENNYFLWYAVRERKSLSWLYT